MANPIHLPWNYSDAYVSVAPPSYPEPARSPAHPIDCRQGGIATNFIGDIHGDFQALTRITQHDRRKHYIALGDVGFGFGEPVPAYPNVGFIRGNHDDPAAARAHPNYLGDFGVHNGIFFLGGAYSIDYAWRQEEMRQGGPALWWPDEELSTEALAGALALYVTSKPRMVATHEAPTNVIVHLLTSRDYRPEKLPCAFSRTAVMLQRMLNHHQPKHWLFGHYHLDWEERLGETTFHCLNELAVKEVAL
jgi:Calcineurin-like phosphoesterase